MSLAGCPSEIAYASENDAVIAERDRCAKIAENWLLAFGQRGPTSGVVSAQTWANDAVRDIIEAIRTPQ